MLILIGLSYAAAVCWRLLSASGGTRATVVEWPKEFSFRMFFTFRVALIGSQLFLAAGFWQSHSTDLLWIIAVVGYTVGVGNLVLKMLRRREGREIHPGALAVVLATSVLVELGSLLAVRLVVVRDPSAPFAAGLGVEALKAGGRVLALPLLGFAAVLLLLRLKAFRKLSRLAESRAGGLWLFDGMRSASGEAHNPGSDAGRVPSGRAAAARILLACVIVSILFVLPLFGRAVGGAKLTIKEIATPEYGKILLLIVLAHIVLQESHRFGPSSGQYLWESLRGRNAVRSLAGGGPATLVRFRYALYPLGLFAVVAVISGGFRHDFGTLVSALTATIGVTWAAARHAVQQSPDAHQGALWSRTGRRLTQTFKAYLLFLVLGGTMLVLAGFLAVTSTNYVQERARIWADPWAFRWEGGCVPVEQGSPGVPVLCQESLLANVESARSQAGRALAAVADGGLWGRGLRDVSSSAVPADSTDFILAVVWNKLGGIAVLLIAVLIVLLGTALRQAAGGRSESDEPSGVVLFASGLGAMIVGQFLFVFAATVNVVPHSGIPAPFLSRGGQSTLAMLLGIALVLVLAPREPAGSAYDPAPAGAVSRTPGRPGRLGVLAPMAFCLSVVTVVTLLPYTKPFPLPTVYDAGRPQCPAREPTRKSLSSLPPPAETCSNDRIAFNRTRIEIHFNGKAGLLQIRPGGEWKPLDDEVLAGMTVQDLTGLVKVDGGGTGIVDQSYADVVSATAGTALLDRLQPPPATAEPDGILDLTIDPRLQHVMAAAMRTASADGGGPLAGGMVVIDARSGHILASTSVPAQLTRAEQGVQTVDTVEVAKFVEDHPSYGRLSADGRLERPAGEGDCERGQRTQEQIGCWKWDYIRPAGVSPAVVADQLRYVDGDPKVKLPPSGINRALGTRYGLGSTFKVIVAAAYLEGSGRSAGDMIDAPDVVELEPGVPIANSGGAACRGAVNGRISLTQALSVSCNTAFVMLAQRIGWAAIAKQAQRFGLTVGSCKTGQPERPWLATPLKGVAGSCVPPTSSRADLGNNVLGGLYVKGTPLAMAAVLAAVANDGRAVQPTLVTSVTRPGRDGEEPAPSPAVQTALSSAASAELVKALSQTAVTGTASGLQDAAGARLWVKTGTHELKPTPGPDQFTRNNSWLVGFVQTARGPVAFAVVVEAREGRVGGRRTRYLVETLVKALGATP